MSERDRLLALLTERSYAKREVTLASGKKSDFFIDCKQTVLTAEGHALVGALMLEALPKDVLAVAGVELGGCPLASAVALISFQKGRPVDAIYVRKEAKDHGSARLLEGNVRIPAGSRVAVLEDVITTGGSTLKCVEKLRAAGYEVASVIAIVDRSEGGRQNIENAGLTLTSLFCRDDFPR
ncbi:MAG: orotate phosphoribosyltransferase [Polyangiales bacterium]